MPRDATRVFEDLRFSANEMVTFRWDEGASAGVRGAKSVLSEEWTRRAAPLRVEEVVGEEVSQGGSSQGQTLGGAKPKKEYSAAEKENKLKNLLGKGLFKRK
jgi:tether containing UBX domain for GLUT4